MARDRVDPARFSLGRIGPYLLGRIVRTTDVGEVVVALHHEMETVVELERFTELEGSHLADHDGLLLKELNHVVGLEHRHLATVIGAGIHNQVPYLVRNHRLGRTLAEVDDPIEEATAGAILHAVADALRWLAGQGPEPGSCSVGGITDADVFLGFDGTVTVLGAGLRLIRCPHCDPAAADTASLPALAHRFSIDLGDPAADIATTLRKRYRDACGERRALIGALLRQRFEADIARERAWFGLSTLH